MHGLEDWSLPARERTGLAAYEAFVFSEVWGGYFGMVHRAADHLKPEKGCAFQPKAFEELIRYEVCIRPI